MGAAAQEEYVMEIPDDQREMIVEGMAAIAVTLAEMGHGEEDTRQQVVSYLVERLRIDETDLVPVIREAATAIQTFPQPTNEPAEQLERGRPVRQMLGLPEPAEELEAMLRAREWLERLATELEQEFGH
jgi:hypothetical protein